MVCAIRTIAVAGSTSRSGTIRWAMSTAEIATRTQQKNAAIAASNVRPNSSTQAAMSTPDTARRRGRRGRSSPRSCGTCRGEGGTRPADAVDHAMGAEQVMHAERGRRSERLSGTRAERTLRKLPMARPGAKASTARAGFIPRSIGAFRAEVDHYCFGVEPPDELGFGGLVRLAGVAGGAGDRLDHPHRSAA